MRQAQEWESVQTKLQLIREKAKADQGMAFTTLLHHVYNVETLRAAFYSLKRDAAPGVDGVTWQEYEEGVEARLKDLAERLKRGAYRPKEVRRTYIPKTDGTKRPLGVTATEDKIVQRAMVEVLNAIYETDFKGFSYGFRPKRSQHNALDALYVMIKTRKVNWILDADIRDFFGSINFETLLGFLRKRIADERVIRIIQKWLKAGVLEDGEVTYAEEGAPQGASVSPLLANVYLHYVYDEWILQWRQEKARGAMHFVRFADDTIVGFQYQAEAEEFLSQLKKRFEEYGLGLHPEKTRLLEFGRFAASNRAARKEGKPETFNFLGFTHICGKTQDGRFTIVRRTIRKRMRAKLDDVKAELRKRINDPVVEVGTWLTKVVNGHYQYYGVPGNYQPMSDFRYNIALAWHQVLSRRSQNGRVLWTKMLALMSQWLPSPHIKHPYPDERFFRSTQGRSRVR